MTKEQIKIDLINKFNANGWNPIHINPKGKFHSILITPCFDTDEHNENTVCFFMVDDPCINGLSTNDIDHLAKEIETYDKLYYEDIKQREELNEFYNKNINRKPFNQDAWDFYSDWHKDIYGYRPHRRICNECN